jgi:type 2 lantibiotic biosynthesis protein LanM
MVEVASVESILSETSGRPFCECPLPIPEHLRGHGLVRCLDAIEPQIQEVRLRVRQRAQRLIRTNSRLPFDPLAVEEALAANLAEPLLTMMTRVMVLELNVARLEGRLFGDTPQERFASFLDRLRTPSVAQELFQEYPVLVQQVVNRLEQWAAFSAAFLRHICEDWKSIRHEFFSEDPGPIVSIHAGAGDTHKNGQSVVVASFGAGGRLVYKPRSLSVDEHFQQLLAWLNDRGAEPEFRLLEVLNQGDHGWVEFVATEPCTTDNDVCRFYRRQGAYIAMLYALEASDFHCENLIASGQHPMLIDLEALFHPRLDQNASNRADHVAGRTLGYSVLRVGLLPQRYWASEESDGVDMSGLGTTAGQLTPAPVPYWEHSDTDEMRVVRKRMEMSGSDNRPTLNGVEVNPFDYAEAIANGFSSMYRILLSHREKLLHLIQLFAEDEVRVIVRATQTYGMLLHESFHPDVLRDPGDRDALFDRLHTAAEIYPSLNRVIPVERADLLRNDIPLFTTKPCSRDLWTSDNQCIRDYFDEPGMALVERRIQQLSETDLERQLWIVRASIATLASHAQGPAIITHQAAESALEIGPAQLKSAACTIGDRLEELALHGEDEVSWIGLVPIEEQQWRLAPLGPDLYDGLAGVILFLAYLGSVSEDQRYVTLARSALRTLRGQVEERGSNGNIGGFIGRGGLIYSLSHVGAIWSDASLLLEAERLASSIPDLIPNDKRLDLVGGAAGCLLGLISLHHCKPSEIVKRSAVACGNHLLQTGQRMYCGIGWVHSDLAPVPLTGFAHGNAGIAYALAKLSKLTGEAGFASAACEAIKYERAQFSPEHGNWPDLRERKAADFLHAWCHGAPGIGLARLASLDCLDDPELGAEITVALNTTLEQGFGSNHTLCHGDLGNVDVLLQAARTLHEPRWELHARRIAARILAGVPETGWVCGNPLGLESPGLMTGLAGIGYELLRLAEPDYLPSVLALANPILS